MLVQSLFEYLLWLESYCPETKVWWVTIVLDLGTIILFMTHHLVEIHACAMFQSKTSHDWKNIDRKRKYNGRRLTLTFDLDLGTYILFMAYSSVLVVIHACARFHSNTSHVSKVIDRKRTYDWRHLTFDLGTCILFMTHRRVLYMLVQRFIRIPIMVRKLLTGNESVTGELWSWSLTLTFDLGSWILFVTHRPVVIHACTKLYLNTSHG
jgi:hypothetical protein